MAKSFYDNLRSSPGSQLFRFAPGSYFERTSRPIYALMYLLVFIILYELGLFLLNPDVLDRPLSEIPGLVVAFAWVHNLLTYFGFTNQLAWMGTPIVVIIILLAMQFTSKTSFAVKVGDFLPMTLECIVWAIPLIVLSLLLNYMVNNSAPKYRPVSPSPAVVSLEGHVQEGEFETVYSEQAVQIPQTAEAQEDTADTEQSGSRKLLLNIVTGIGAGIYEELIFRLFLICVLMIIINDVLGFSRTSSAVMAILISAALFSWHHHFYFLDGRLVKGEAVVPIRFIFRMLAGIYLSVIFAFRGFGLAAATHACHNVIAAVMNSMMYDG